MNGVKAAIFDMDGLMLDSERVGVDHFKRVAEEFGYPGIVDVYLRTVGRTRADSKRIFTEALGEAFPFEDVRQKCREHFYDHSARHGIPVKAGVRELLDKLNDIGIPKAVATSNSRSAALTLLGNSRLLDDFQAIVGGDEISRGKPSPEIFLKAAERLRVAPCDCVVFEDSGPGIEGAYTAGMTPILVPDLIAPSERTLSLAYKVFNSLTECVAMFAWEARA